MVAEHCVVATGWINGWQCQRITRVDSVLYLIERADGKLHEAPASLRPHIDAAIDGVKDVPHG